jgi:hypothetical protein
VEGLGFNYFYVQSPCNPLIEDYTEIFYMTDAGDIPSIQCKMSLTGPKSTRKVDGLNLIFTDFYVPALTFASNSPSIITCVSIVAKTYLSSRCLATDVIM